MFENVEIIDYEHIFGYFGVKMLKNSLQNRKNQVLAIVEKYKRIIYGKAKSKQLALLKKQLLNNMNFEEFELPYAHAIQKSKIQFFYKLKIFVALLHPFESHYFIMGQACSLKMLTEEYSYIIKKRSSRKKFLDYQKLYEKKKIWREIKNCTMLEGIVDK